MQRRTYRVLRFTARRSVPVRAVSDFLRQRARTQNFWISGRIRRSSRRFALSAGGIYDLLFVQPSGHLHALSGTGLYGRQYARPIDRGLRKILTFARASSRRVCLPPRNPFHPLHSSRSAPTPANRRAGLARSLMPQRNQRIHPGRLVRRYKARQQRHNRQ